MSHKLLCLKTLILMVFGSKKSCLKARLDSDSLFLVHFTFAIIKVLKANIKKSKLSRGCLAFGSIFEYELSKSIEVGHEISYMSKLN